MRTHRSLVAISVLAAALAVPAVPAGAADPATCDPLTAPVYRGQVPTPQEVLGFDLGEREVTVAEADRYLTAVAQASPRAVSATMTTTEQGRALEYAIVGNPANVTPGGLARIRVAAAALRDPRTPAGVVRHLVRSTPEILWVTGNVHGNEESGADAALRTLRDLADRVDCAARRILDSAIVVVVPSQNPDGRDADTRRNSFGFDLNRDWFARTQLETDAKLALLNQFPPQVYIDAHEMGGTGYFFPPNADPVYHEVSGQSLDWIDRYGTTLAQEFTRQGIDFFTRDTFDLFYMGYGDTVPSTGFGGAGMTFEKGGNSPIADRTQEHFLTQWLTLSVAAENPADLLSRWHDTFVEAARQGAAGQLEPNEVINPGNEVAVQVPDRLVRHYFLRSDDPAKSAAVRQIVRRLQRMDVDVRQLVRPLRVSDFRAYGRAPQATTLPAGTYWISMAQGQKHWIQAMLNEDTYVPFTFFFDVSAWSLPLLSNVGGGSSGLELRPQARRVPLLRAPSFAVAPGSAPRVAMLRTSTGPLVESEGWLRYQLEKVWQIPHRVVTPADIVAGALDGTDALIVPDLSANAALTGLGEPGRAALARWVNGGGNYIGWGGGTALAAQLGISTAQLAESTSVIPGTLFRVNVRPGSRIGTGVGATAWQLNASDRVMRASDPSHVAVAYPQASSPDWFVSGFQSGAEQELSGTAAVLDEPVGQGRAVVFAGDPLFRAFTDGTAALVRNAILGARPAPAAAGVGSGDRAAAEQRARTAALSLTDGHPLRLTVRTSDAQAAADLIGDLGREFRTVRGSGTATYLVPADVSADHDPWTDRLIGELERRGIQPVGLVA